MEEYKTSKIEFVLKTDRPDIGSTSNKKTRGIEDSVGPDQGIGDNKKNKPTMQSLAARIMRVSELIIPNTIIKTILAIPRIIGPIIAIFTTVVLGILAHNAFSRLISGWFSKDQQTTPTEISLGDSITEALMNDPTSGIEEQDNIGEPLGEDKVTVDVELTGDDPIAKIDEAASKEVSVNTKYNIDTSDAEGAPGRLASVGLTSPLGALYTALTQNIVGESSLIKTTLVPAYTSLSSALSDVINKMYTLNTGSAAPVSATMIDPELVSSPVVTHPVHNLIDTEAVSWLSDNPTNYSPSSSTPQNPQGQ